MVRKILNIMMYIVVMVESEEEKKLLEVDGGSAGSPTAGDASG